MSSVHHDTFENWYKEASAKYEGGKGWINVIALDTLFMKIGKLRVPHEHLKRTLTEYFSLGFDENVSALIVTKRAMVCGVSTNNSVILAKNKNHEEISLFGAPSIKLDEDMGHIIIKNLITSTLWDLKDDNENGPKVFDADTIGSIIYDKSVTHYTREILCSIGRGGTPEYIDIMKYFSDLKHLTMSLRKYLDH